jgi:hypothetical protein
MPDGAIRRFERDALVAVGVEERDAHAIHEVQSKDQARSTSQAVERCEARQALPGGYARPLVVAGPLIFEDEYP